jgi:hypothetical protein
MIMRSVVHQTHEIMAREMQEGRDFFALAGFRLRLRVEANRPYLLIPAKHEIAASAAAHST